MKKVLNQLVKNRPIYEKNKMQKKNRKFDVDGNGWFLLLKMS